MDTGRGILHADRLHDNITEMQECSVAAHNEEWQGFSKESLTGGHCGFQASIRLDLVPNQIGTVRNLSENLVYLRVRSILQASENLCYNVIYVLYNRDLKSL